MTIMLAPVGKTASFRTTKTQTGEEKSIGDHSDEVSQPKEYFWFEARRRQIGRNCNGLEWISVCGESDAKNEQRICRASRSRICGPGVRTLQHHRRSLEVQYI